MGHLALSHCHCNTCKTQCKTKRVLITELRGGTPARTHARRNLSGNRTLCEHRHARRAVGAAESDKLHQGHLLQRARRCFQVQLLIGSAAKLDWRHLYKLADSTLPLTGVTVLVSRGSDHLRPLTSSNTLLDSSGKLSDPRVEADTITANLHARPCTQ